MANTLFPNFSRSQEEAIRSFRATSLGRVVSAAAASIQRGRSPRDAARQIARDLGQRDARVCYARSAASTGDFRSSAQRRAEGVNHLADVTAALGSQLGGLIGAMVRPNGIPVGGATTQAELAVAAALLEAFGWQVTPPRPADDRPTAPDARPEWLRPKRPSGEFEYRTGERLPDAPEWFDRGRFRKQSGIPRHTDSAQSYLPTDPTLTGEMIRVRSSNVHSIGYKWNSVNPRNGTLVVRFLEGKPKTNAGAVYAYDKVPPEVFTSFRIAASKGKFVWDRLRIRGTVTGHQYSYRLLQGGVSGYIPRQATLLGHHQYYLRRLGPLRSQLADEYVSPLTRRGVSRLIQRGGVFNRTAPVQPIRGTPNRGR